VATKDLREVVFSHCVALGSEITDEPFGKTLQNPFNILFTHSPFQTRGHARSTDRDFHLGHPVARCRLKRAILLLDKRAGRACPLCPRISFGTFQTWRAWFTAEEGTTTTDLRK
jgi:hypothetical protein